MVYLVVYFKSGRPPAAEGHVLTVADARTADTRRLSLLMDGNDTMHVELVDSEAGVSVSVPYDSAFCDGEWHKATLWAKVADGAEEKNDRVNFGVAVDTTEPEEFLEKNVRVADAAALVDALRKCPIHVGGIPGQ